MAEPELHMYLPLTGLGNNPETVHTHPALQPASRAAAIGLTVVSNALQSRSVRAWHFASSYGNRRTTIGLKSNLFRGDPALEACLVQDSAHILQGVAGGHVSRIQQALNMVDGYDIATGGRYAVMSKVGPTTPT